MPRDSALRARPAAADAKRFATRKDTKTRVTNRCATTQSEKMFLMRRNVLARASSRESDRSPTSVAEPATGVPCRSPPMVRRVASCSVFVFFRVAKRFRVSRPNGSGGCGDAAARRRRPPGLNASRGGSQSARRGLQPQSTAHRRGGGAARSGANFRGSARRARPLRPPTHGFNRQARVFYSTWKIRDKGPDAAEIAACLTDCRG